MSCIWKNCMCKKIGHLGHTKKGSRVHTVEQENSFDEHCRGKSDSVHTNFGSVELWTVSDKRKTIKSLITFKSAGRKRSIQGRHVQVQKALLSPTTCTRKSLRNLCKRFTNLLKVGLKAKQYIQRVPYLFRISTRTENYLWCTLLWKATPHHCWIVMPAWIWKRLSSWIINW